MTASSAPHLLIFENRTEGHHLHWLRYITEDFLTLGGRITLALDYRPEMKDRIDSQLLDLTEKVSMISIYDGAGTLRGGTMINTIAVCLEESGSREVFMNNLDEIASGCLRRAAFGIYPARNTQGKLSGVYFRPRFLANPAWPPGNMIKEYGFRKLCRLKWLNKIYLMDEYLMERARQRYPGPKYFFLPDPWDGTFPHDQTKARERLGIPPDRFVFLSYGIGDRRKGLHLTVRAVMESSADSRLYLLCAGAKLPDRKTAEDLKELGKRGKAKVIDRYVSEAEQSLCFCASDVVLLPYIKHFGSSGVLSLAAAAGKMVIASDEGLLAQQVQRYELGWLFRSGSIEELKKCMNNASLLKVPDMARFQQAADRYAQLCSRDAFKKALLSPFGHE